MGVTWKAGRTVLLAAAGLGVMGRALLNRAEEADLQGQVALITGGSRGLGLLLAREFGREGCRIAICARDGKELQRARGDLAREGLEVQAVVCDVTDERQVAHLIDEVTRHYGRIDILVNNAGIIQVGPVQVMKRADYEQAMDLMFWGVFNVTQAALPRMLERRSGRIVNITSVGGKVAVPHLLPYVCAKFAAVGFSEGLHAELAGKGIIVTTIVPGEMRTGSFEQARFKGKQEAEFTWFAASSSLPFMSMDAERAARQIVEATKRGEAERILSLPAAVMARFHGLFPGATGNLLGLANRFLPSADGGTGETARGAEVHDRAETPLLNGLTRLGQSAARRFNEQGGR
jgi:NAD(P)-dependent dehydrogenase (short-subunit alcohol dehydrogenase family)